MKSRWLWLFCMSFVVMSCNERASADVIILNSGDIPIGPNGENTVFRPKGRHIWTTPDGLEVETFSDGPIIVGSGDGDIQILTGRGNSQVSLHDPKLPDIPYNNNSLILDVTWIDGTYGVLWGKDRTLLGHIYHPGVHVLVLPPLPSDGSGTIIFDTKHGGDIVIDDIEVLSVPEPGIMDLPIWVIDSLLDL